MAWLVLLLGTSCTITPPADVFSCPDGRCPSGMICDRNVCRHSAAPHDSGVDAGGPATNETTGCAADGCKVRLRKGVLAPANTLQPSSGLRLAEQSWTLVRKRCAVTKQQQQVCLSGGLEP